ncbi:Ig-like domain repeat protein [Salinibacterium sp. ZJ450]|uniref:Ig-like domain repeat protein n=1 Tax=Salinibacterium sp. ZJ450 TaxID=2708338 RepID=UPI001423670E|nr:Ig-like domain repeat protein [Salinibacterium sp. ZJ450]
MIPVPPSLRPSRRSPRRALLAAATALTALLVGAATVAPAHAAAEDVNPALGTYQAPLYVTPTSGVFTATPGAGYSGGTGLTRLWTGGVASSDTTSKPENVRVLLTYTHNGAKKIVQLDTTGIMANSAAAPVYDFNAASLTQVSSLLTTSNVDPLRNIAQSTNAPLTFSVLLQTSGIDLVNPDQPYFRADFELAADGNSWSFLGTNPAPVDKTDTTTQIAGSPQLDGSVELTATVAPIAATGMVSFQNAAGEEQGTGTVTNGVVMWTSGALTAGTDYVFKAVYSGDTAHEGSTSGTITVKTEAAPATPVNTTITVDIPSGGPGTVALQGASAASLGEASNTGTLFEATGQLGEVTVIDSRLDKNAGWSMSGKVKDPFVSGANQIPASALGWTPAAVGTLPTGVTVGSVVAAGSPGLADSKPLLSAVGSAQAGTVTSKVNAGLKLQAPSSTPAGSYSSTLTITLT